MRYAIWAAVSTLKQAASDKGSLAEQEQQGRAVGDAKGWMETSGPYVVKGASRSFYVDLSQAEHDIPELHQMLEDAQNNKFDILVIYSYDRLGDLRDMVAQTLRFYGKQIYSVSQPAEPQMPETYDPYANDNEAIMRAAASITQHFRIADLRRKYKANMPKRVLERGLNPHRIPWGYKWVGKKDPPELIPACAVLLVQMKDMILRGHSVLAVARYADTTGLKPTEGDRWHPKSVMNILRNPFYAGIVAINKSYSVRDLRRKNQKRTIPLPRSKWRTAKGKQTPVWDEKTWLELMDEFDRRLQLNIRRGAKYPLSGILTCATCGDRLHRRSHSSGRHRRMVLTCQHETHVFIDADRATEQVFQAFATHVQSVRREGQTLSRMPSVYEQAVDHLKTQRKRIQYGFQVGVFDQTEATEALAALDRQIEDMDFKKREGENLDRLRQEYLELLPEDVKVFQEYLKIEDPTFVQRLLSAFLEEIVVHPNSEIEYKWRPV